MTGRKIGRPLSFDREAALREAMLLFWRSGYETTSLAELTAAMGVSPPSIYAAFGDKKRLFLQAVDLYLAKGGARVIEQSPSAPEAAWALLEGAAIGFSGEDTPAGCLLATSAITGSPDSADVRAHLAGIRREIEGALRARVQRGIAAGELPAACDADALAGLVMATVQGLSTLARDGASREKLLRVARTAMLAWPDAEPPRERQRRS